MYHPTDPGVIELGKGVRLLVGTFTVFLCVVIFSLCVTIWDLIKHLRGKR